MAMKTTFILAAMIATSALCQAQLIALQSVHSQTYLAACDGCSSGTGVTLAFAHVDNSGPSYTHWTQTPVAGIITSFKCEYNNKFLAVCNQCTPGSAYPDVAAVHVDTNKDVWAQYVQITVDADKGHMAFQSLYNGKLLSYCFQCNSRAVYEHQVYFHVDRPSSNADIPTYSRWIIKKL
ncbi:hypothetical protein HK104_006973 [Borealophlyctis nickersoniae]|nr:hypothetical protein HK104_006973 [Borealophlyctis nickersoniae]